ncbi:MAG: hypothetical protein ACKO0M_06390 [Cyanobium sp.]
MSAPAPGPPHRTGESRSLRGIPRSRAFWELKAEQMMNRIFDPEEPIDLAVEPSPAEQELREPTITAVPGQPTTTAELRERRPDSEAAADPTLPTGATAGDLRPTRPRPASRRPGARQPATVTAARTARRPDERLVLIGALCGVCMVSVAGSLLYFGYWNRLQQSLSQERNLLLVERLRSLGPANPAPVPGPEPATPTLPAPAQGTAQAGAEGLPPPPPDEPWIQQLSTLPQAPPPPSRVLTVPVSPRLGAPAPAAAPAASAPAPPAAPLPQLVGVLGGAGRAGSAIFLVGGTSMNVSSGEQIGSSGWRLRSADGETALIERGGDVRQVSIVSGSGF